LKLDNFADKVEVIEISASNRPAGPRFGTLVHAVLAAVPLDATPEGIRLSAELQGRIFGATSQEVDAAITTVANALQHPLMKRARVALASGRCHREMPLVLQDLEGILVEGIADLVFEEEHLWFVVDFKTDQELASELERYRRQVGIYAAAIAKVTGSSTTAFLLRV
jgi:ATP-dependent exoDNAse (exonuclease V) beta subunit